MNIIMNMMLLLIIIIEVKLYYLYSVYLWIEELQRPFTRYNENCFSSLSILTKTGVSLSAIEINSSGTLSEVSRRVLKCAASA